MSNYPADADLDRPADPGAADLLSRPEWAIVGGRLADGRYRIIASKELTGARLAYDAAVQEIGGDLLDPSVAMVAHRTITMECVIRRFVIIEGPSYGACLDALFANWAPDAGQAALPAGGTR
jgi:hypothetical protein